MTNVPSTTGPALPELRVCPSTTTGVFDTIVVPATTSGFPGVVVISWEPMEMTVGLLFAACPSASFGAAGCDGSLLPAPTVIATGAPLGLPGSLEEFAGLPDVSVVGLAEFWPAGGWTEVPLGAGVSALVAGARLVSSPISEIMAPAGSA